MARIFLGRASRLHEQRCGQHSSRQWQRRRAFDNVGEMSVRPKAPASREDRRIWATHRHPRCRQGAGQLAGGSLCHGHAHGHGKEQGQRPGGHGPKHGPERGNAPAPRLRKAASFRGEALQIPSGVFVWLSPFLFSSACRLRQSSAARHRHSNHRRHRTNRRSKPRWIS